MLRPAATACLLSLLLIAGCGQEKEELPPQDEFRVLKTRLYQVQTAVAARDSTGINELLTPSLRGEVEGVDSLLAFVYGPSVGFEFEGFINYQIFYTLDRARIDCDMAGSGSDTIRDATLTFELVDSLWLLKRWEPKLPATSAEDD